MEENILSIVQVDTVLTGIEPHTLEIFAYGLTRTSGWTNGRLVPHIYLTPPADGVYGFDFVANIPDVELSADSRVRDLGGDFVRGVTAIHTWINFPENLVGVKVFAQRNTMKSFYNEPIQRITA